MNLKYLSDVELLENFMPKETAQNILHEYSSIYNVMNSATEKQLKSFKGITPVRVRKILCIKELVSRMQREKQKQLKIITTPKDVIEYFRFLEDKDKEEFWVMMLNTKNGVIGSKCVSIGTLNMALAQPREIFNVAIRYMASSVIVAHNHPSGDCTPSMEDIAVTKNIIKAGKLLNIECLDHIIIGKQKSISLKQEGVIK
ncbi:RadC family protein [Megamonas hypermegale]|uniref:RadC family protein n=1 Tax=Megamonas hypermegale TaxID=158847 RepID=UPI00195976FA|nr:DNA repair protein RadC [Megamonas hypermegale]MBM6833912.1 DNA repair protein RadC [Megamonas hypermegale]